MLRRKGKTSQTALPFASLRPLTTETNPCASPFTIDTHTSYRPTEWPAAFPAN